MKDVKVRLDYPLRGSVITSERSAEVLAYHLRKVCTGWSRLTAVQALDIVKRSIEQDNSLLPECPTTLTRLDGEDR